MAILSLSSLFFVALAEGCLSPWTGPSCEQLDLLPVDASKMGFDAPNVLPRPQTSSWGGSVLYDELDGLYHMFVCPRKFAIFSVLLD